MKTSFIYKLKSWAFYINSHIHVYVIHPYQRATRWFDDQQLYNLSSTVKQLYIAWIEKNLEDRRHLTPDVRAIMIGILEDLKSPFPKASDYQWLNQKWLKEGVYNHQLRIRKALKRAANLF